MWVSYAEDTEIWVTAENAYKERVSRVEIQIIQGFGTDLARHAIRGFLPFSIGQRYVHSSPLVIFLLNDTDVDSWCDTGVPLNLLIL